MRQGPCEWLLGVIRLVTTGRAALAPRGRGRPPNGRDGCTATRCLTKGHLPWHPTTRKLGDGMHLGVQCRGPGEGAQTGSLGSPPQSSGGAFDWHTWAMGTSVSECAMLLQNVEE